VLRFFFHPLISADGRDAENVEFLGLQEYEDGLLIACVRPASILINDDFDFLGGGGGEKRERKREIAYPFGHDRLHPFLLLIEQHCV